MPTRNSRRVPLRLNILVCRVSRWVHKKRECMGTALWRMVRYMCKKEETSLLGQQWLQERGMLIFKNKLNWPKITTWDAVTRPLLMICNQLLSRVALSRCNQERNLLKINSKKSKTTVSPSMTHLKWRAIEMLKLQLIHRANHSQALAVFMISRKSRLRWISLTIH